MHVTGSVGQVSSVLVSMFDASGVEVRRLDCRAPLCHGRARRRDALYVRGAAVRCIAREAARGLKASTLHLVGEVNAKENS